jgi:RNA polymerase sigma-70 factor, ECF subfamily
MKTITADSPQTDEPGGGSPVERFCVLFEQHGRSIYGHVRSLVPNASDADEVFQETCVTLWQKFDQYRPETNFRAWAYRIAYYKALKLRDRKSAQPYSFSPQFLDLVSEESIVMADVLDARTEALWLCRDKLDQNDRDLLDRFHSEGATAKDVAHWAGRNVHFVYRAIRRIHDTLFDCIRLALLRDRQS